jgi:hypothetical protein
MPSSLQHNSGMMTIPLRYFIFVDLVEVGGIPVMVWTPRMED